MKLNQTKNKMHLNNREMEKHPPSPEYGYIRNEELMHERFPKYSCMGTARIK